MRRTFIFFGSIVFMFSLLGCPKDLQQPMTAGSVDVIIEGGGEFPEFLVGKWRGVGQSWGFAFEPGGKIAYARIPMGGSIIKADEVTILPTKQGGKATFVPGDWVVKYSPENRELSVMVVMDLIRIEMAGEALQGNVVHEVRGVISEDGKMWDTVIDSYPEYEGFPVLPEELPFQKKVLFAKVVAVEI